MAGEGMRFTDALYRCAYAVRVLFADAIWIANRALCLADGIEKGSGSAWGPKNQNDQNIKAEGCLSDHPWVYAEFEMPADTGSF